MYEEMSRQGRLTNTFLKGIGFDCDLAYVENSVDYLSDTMPYMRSMCTSHEYQRKLRLKEEEKQTAAINTARIESTGKVTNILKLADECTVTLYHS